MPASNNNTFTSIKLNIADFPAMPFQMLKQSGKGYETVAKPVTKHVYESKVFTWRTKSGFDRTFLINHEGNDVYVFLPADQEFYLAVQDRKLIYAGIVPFSFRYEPDTWSDYRGWMKNFVFHPIQSVEGTKYKYPRSEEYFEGEHRVINVKTSDGWTFEDVAWEKKRWAAEYHERVRVNEFINHSYAQFTQEFLEKGDSDFSKIYYYNEDQEYTFYNGSVKYPSGVMYHLPEIEL